MADELVFGRDGTDRELTKLVVAEGLPVELGVELRRGEVLKTGAVAVVQQHHMCVRGRAQATIEGDADEPLCHVSLWNATPNHAFEVHDEIKSDAVGIVGVGNDDVLAPGRVFYRLFHL